MLCRVLTLLVWTAVVVVPAPVLPEGSKPPAEVSVQSDSPWNARRVEHDGAILYMLVPATSAAATIPLSVMLENRGNKTFQCGESGYLLDCKLNLTAANGKQVPFTNQGASLFFRGQMGGQYASVQYSRGKIRHWHYDMSRAFEPLEAGRYELTMEATIWFQDEGTKEFAKPVKLVAKGVDFSIRPEDGECEKEDEN